MPCRPASADETNAPWALAEGNEEKTSPHRTAHDDFTVLDRRMARIVVNPGQRVAENGERFLE